MNEEDYAALQDARGWLFSMRQLFLSLLWSRLQERQWARLKEAGQDAQYCIGWPDIIWELQPGDFAAVHQRIKREHPTAQNVDDVLREFVARITAQEQH